MEPLPQRTHPVPQTQQRQACASPSPLGRKSRIVIKHLQVDLRQTIEAAVEMVAADALKKGLEIAYSLAPELQQRKILGDTIRIRQVLRDAAAGLCPSHCWPRWKSTASRVRNCSGKLRATKSIRTSA